MDSKMLLKCRLNIAKFNTMTTNFDLLVPTTNVDKVPIIEQLHQIASCIWSISIGRLSPITDHNGWATNHQFSLLSWLNNGTILFLCPDIIARASFTNRNR